MQGLVLTTTVSCLPRKGQASWMAILTNNKHRWKTHGLGVHLARALHRADGQPWLALPTPDLGTISSEPHDGPVRWVLSIFPFTREETGSGE